MSHRMVVKLSSNASRTAQISRSSISPDRNPHRNEHSARPSRLVALAAAQITALLVSVGELAAVFGRHPGPQRCESGAVAAGGGRDDALTFACVLLLLSSGALPQCNPGFEREEYGFCPAR